MISRSVAAFDVAVLFAWLVSACASASGNGTLIGATCQASSDCDVGGVCIIDGKDGLCTLPCEVAGGAGQCPLGAYCDSASRTSDTRGPSTMTLCLPACKAASDCRDGYVCAAVSDGFGKVCQPG